MEWWEAFLLIMGSLFFLMFIGMPVAFTFLVVNVVGAYFFFGGLPGMSQLVIQISDSLSTFTLVPVALFLVMGEIMFHSGIGVNLLDALDKWFGNLKGRLALLAWQYSTPSISLVDAPWILRWLQHLLLNQYLFLKNYGLL